MGRISSLKQLWENLKVSTDSSEPNYKRRNVSARRDFPGDSVPVSRDGSDYDPSEEAEVTVGSNGSDDDDDDDESWGTKFVGFETEMRKDIKFDDSFNGLNGFHAANPGLAEEEGGLVLFKPKYKRRDVSARRDFPVGLRGSFGVVAGDHNVVVGGDESDYEPSEESMVGSDEDDEYSVALAVNRQTDYFDCLLGKLDHMVADVLQQIMMK
ncbi:unnamed protein product [Cuscuta campestris]|uniref:Uncharacterized protein n=1 Tax=Cuscuta campestris TaxID=132261 RepID=A0A484KMB6_9ASTE|nr:unnamed protein product [Cuscuta campestris]